MHAQIIVLHSALAVCPAVNGLPVCARLPAVIYWRSHESNRLKFISSWLTENVLKNIEQKSLKILQLYEQNKYYFLWFHWKIVCFLKDLFSQPFLKFDVEKHYSQNNYSVVLWKKNYLLKKIVINIDSFVITARMATIIKINNFEYWIMSLRYYTREDSNNIYRGVYCTSCIQCLALLQTNTVWCIQVNWMFLWNSVLLRKELGSSFSN